LDKVTVILTPTRENIKIVAKAMKEGAIVIYPSESSYGIGCDFTNKAAVEHIYAIKKRPKNKPMICIVQDLETAKRYGKVSAVAEILVNKFMPGPLTLAVPGKGKLEWFNFRISENTVARILASEVGEPIVSTSANTSGDEPIYSSDELEQFSGNVDVILDAGNLPHRLPSTVVMVQDKKVRILREGAIPKSKIKAALEVK